MHNIWSFNLFAWRLERILFVGAGQSRWLIAVEISLSPSIPMPLGFCMFCFRVRGIVFHLPLLFYFPEWQLWPWGPPRPLWVQPRVLTGTLWFGFGKLNRWRRELPRWKSNRGRRAEVSVVTYEASAVRWVLLATILCELFRDFWNSFLGKIYSLFWTRLSIMIVNS